MENDGTGEKEVDQGSAKTASAASASSPTSPTRLSKYRDINAALHHVQGFTRATKQPEHASYGIQASYIDLPRSHSRMSRILLRNQSGVVQFSQQYCKPSPQC